MSVTIRTRLAVAAVLVLLGGSLALADTLYLRNGRRVNGRLVSVQGNTVEFAEEGSWGGGRTNRYDREDVDRIELDRRSSGGGSSQYEEGGQGGGRPAGLREREVAVYADRDWTDTRVDVRAGQTVYFTARGKVRWGPDRSDGPAGEKGSPRNPNRPIPNRPAASLIGRVDGDDPFFIGDSEAPIRIRAGGRLYLGINDDFLQDNRGSFQVTIGY